MKLTQKITVIVLAVMAIASMVAIPAFADDKKPVQEKTYAQAAGDKLAEGTGETATGWTETPNQIVKTTKNKNIVEGVTVGTVKGVGQTVAKTTEGAVKAATFYAPGQQKKQADTGVKSANAAAPGQVKKQAQTTTNAAKSYAPGQKKVQLNPAVKSKK